MEDPNLSCHRCHNVAPTIGVYDLLERLDGLLAEDKEIVFRHIVAKYVTNDIGSTIRCDYCTQCQKLAVGWSVEDQGGQCGDCNRSWCPTCAIPDILIHHCEWAVCDKSFCNRCIPKPECDGFSYYCSAKCRSECEAK